MYTNIDKSGASILGIILEVMQLGRNGAKSWSLTGYGLA
jgi:hypothetical protein